MANIVLTNQIFYKNGQGGVSGVVGYESKSNRVVRYTLQPPSSGASSIDLSFTGNYWTEYGVLPETLYFYIGTDPESHANAGKDFERTGELKRKVKTYDYSGSADILLMPNTTYYVWVFPSSTVFGWLYWSKNLGDATVETKGGAVSTVEPVSVMLGNSVEVSVTRHVQTYTHTIKFELGEASGIICEKSENTKILWTPPIDLAGKIVNSDRANATIVVETYNGDQLVGSTSDVEFELIVPETIVPSVSFSWSDLSTAQDAFNALAKGVSFLQIDIDAEGEYGSNIVETETTLNGSPYYGGLVEVSGDVPLTVKVTDSRGRTSSSTQTLFIYEYATPTISVSASRSNEDGSPNETGEFAVVKLKTIVHDVNGKNEANIVLSYGGTSEKIPVSVGEKETTKIIPAPSVSPLYISAIVYDKIKESSVANMTLSIGYATMDFFSGGKGIAFGTTATKEGFTCAMDTDFSGHRVTGLPEPAEAADAATKDYVDQRTAQAPAAAMLPDTEYPAGEWWNGRPVYTKLLAFAPSQITAQILSLPHGIGDLEIGLSVEVLWRYVNAAGNVTWRNFPAVYYGNVEWSAQAYFEGPDHIKLELGSQVRAQMAASAENIYVTLRYVKEEV